jgi:hypothetical protein
MNIPFSVEDFLNVFRLYNTSFRLMPPLMYILGSVSVGLLFSRRAVSNQIISGILAFFWMWMGAVYHIGYFSSINSASVIFGLLFIVQGLVFLLYGTVHGLRHCTGRCIYGCGNGGCRVAEPGGPGRLIETRVGGGRVSIQSQRVAHDNS